MERLGRYRIDGVLGEGGMGTVYAAFDEQLGRPVALKVVRPDKEAKDAEDARARLVREARAASLLRHPSVVTIFDVGEIDGSTFIAMELVEGTSLRTLVHRSGVPAEAKLAWLLDLAGALAEAHRSGLVHRDVKPENVMIARDGGLKVLDFGIARAATREGNQTGLVTLTQDGTTMGTPAYMAPEQIRAEKLDGRADQFAWGVVAFELFSGRLPFEAKEPFALAVEIATKEPPRLASLVEALPDGLDAAVARALAKSPEDRFPSMDALADALRPALPADARRLVVLPTGPLPALRALRDAPTMAPETVQPLATTHLVSAPTAAAIDAAARPRRWLPIGVAAVALAAAGGVALYLRSGPAAGVAPPPSASARSHLAELLAAGQAELRRGARPTHWEQALTVDEGHPPIALRLALYRFRAEPLPAAALFRKARDRRAELTGTDAALLDATAPLFDAQPPDHGEVRRRLVALAEQHPSDAELAYLAGTAIAEHAPGEVAAWGAQYRRATELDPSFARAWQLLAESEAYAGQWSRAAAVVERCLEKVPGAESCLVMRSLLDQQTGRCDRVLEDGRRRQSLEPSAPRPLEAVGQGLLALGKPEEAVLSALGQRWRLLPDGARAAAEAFDRGSVALAHGHFEVAEKHFLAWEKAVAAAPDAATQAGPALALVELYVEQGRSGDAARVASAFLDRVDGLTQGTRAEDFAVAWDPTPVLLDALHRTRKLAGDVVEARKLAWARAYVARGGAWLRPWLWAYGWARVADDEPSARQALLALDALEVGPAPAIDGRQAPRGTPPFAPLTPVGAWIGGALLLAGDATQAKPLLEVAAKDCRVLYRSLDVIRAREALGRAREHAGDRDGACAEFRAVLAQWPEATESRTVERAREGKKRLACE